MHRCFDESLQASRLDREPFELGHRRSSKCFTPGACANPSTNECKKRSCTERTPFGVRVRNRLWALFGGGRSGLLHRSPMIQPD